jgi:hypothetical protein
MVSVSLTSTVSLSIGLADNVTFTEIAKTTGSAYVDSGEILLPSGDTTLESKLYYYLREIERIRRVIIPPHPQVSIIPTGKYTSAPKLVGTSELYDSGFPDLLHLGDRPRREFVHRIRKKYFARGNDRSGGLVDFA